MKSKKSDVFTLLVAISKLPEPRRKIVIQGIMEDWPLDQIRAALE